MVDARVGKWSDVKSTAEDFEVMADCIVNVGGLRLLLCLFDFVAACKRRQCAVQGLVGTW